LGLIKMIDLDSAKEYAVDVVRGSTFFVKYNDREYSVRVDAIKYSPSKTVTLKVQPRYELFEVGSGKELTLLLDSDDTADLKIKVIDVSKNVHASLVFQRLTPFSARYLGPKPEPRSARRPEQRATAPTEYTPEMESGTQLEPVYEEGEEFPYFSLVVKILGGAVAILVILLLIYVLLSKKEKGPIIQEGSNE